MIFGQPGDGLPEKVGTAIGMIVVAFVLSIFVVVLSPMFGY
jgi:hypothetical protein